MRALCRHNCIHGDPGGKINVWLIHIFTWYKDAYGIRQKEHGEQQHQEYNESTSSGQDASQYFDEDESIHLCRRASSMSHMHPSSSPSRGLRLRESRLLEAAANMSGVGRSESLSWDCDSCSFSCTHTYTQEGATHKGGRIGYRGYCGCATTSFFLTRAIVPNNEQVRRNESMPVYAVLRRRASHAGEKIAQQST